MWYDLLIDSEGFLEIKEGPSDLYTWTSGEGCSYDLKKDRHSYTGMNETQILKATSKELYYLD